MSFKFAGLLMFSYSRNYCCDVHSNWMLQSKYDRMYINRFTVPAYLKMCVWQIKQT